MKSRPNILHICTDQQRADSIRALGGWMKTPRLDKLVAEGTSFTRAYTPAAECVPARCCMITGRYADRTNCSFNGDPMPGDEIPTIMSLLAGAGYRTHGVGKCHFTPDSYALKGFQSRSVSEEIPVDPARDDYLRFLDRNGFGDVLEPLGARSEMYYVPQPSRVPERLHHSRWVADECMEFLRKEGGEKPWYLYAGFIQPHPPFSPPDPWHKLYRSTDVPLPRIPENAKDLLCYVNHRQNRFKHRDQGIDMNLVRCIRAYYAACVSFIDHQVGRLMECLAEEGQLDNTLVVFTSDHGELLGDFGSFGKRSFHEAAQRVPMIVRLPGVFEAGRVCESPVSLVDLLPTFAGLAEAGAPDETDGMDLREIAAGTKREEPIFFHYNRAGQAIFGSVGEAGKYVWSAPDQREYFFPAGPEGIADDARPSSVRDDGCLELRGKVLQRAAAFSFADEALSRDKSGWAEYPVLAVPDDPTSGLLFQDPPLTFPKLPEEYEFDYPANGGGRRKG